MPPRGLTYPRGSTRNFLSYRGPIVLGFSHCNASASFLFRTYLFDNNLPQREQTTLGCPLGASAGSNPTSSTIGPKPWGYRLRKHHSSWHQLAQVDYLNEVAQQTERQTHIDFPSTCPSGPQVRRYRKLNLEAAG